MGNTQTRQEQFVAAALEGDTQHVQECMSNADRGRLLDFSTGLFAGRESLLHLAVKNGKAETISAVLGSLVASVTTEIADGAYPGPAAALLGKVVNKQDAKGRTPLLTACYHGHWDCAELLLEAGSNVFACDKDGNGVLHLSAINGHLQLVQQLLAKADTQAITGRLASTVNLSGFTPLHYAAWSGQADIVRCLLAAGVDQLQASWDEYDRWLLVPQGSTPLHVAAGNHHSGVCLMLLQHYALEVHEWLPGDPVPVDPRSRQDQRNTLPVQVATWKGLSPDSQLAMCLDPRVDINSIFSPQQLDEMRRRGPPALRVIAAAAVKQHLLQQLAALLEQQQQEQRWHQLQKQVPRQQQMNVQRQKQQQQQGGDGEQHNWQRWWGRGSSLSTGSPEQHATDGGAGCSAAAHSSHASSLGRANAAATDSSSSKSSTSNRMCDGAGSNHHHADDVDHSELWQGLNRTPSITLGAVQYSKTVGEDDRPDNSCSSAGRSCSSNWQQHCDCAAQNGAGSSNGWGEIEPAGDHAAAAAGAPPAAEIRAAAAAAGSSKMYAAAELSAAVEKLGVDQAVDREQGQLLASSSITLGCLDKIWSFSEQQQQQQHEQQQLGTTKMTTQTAAAVTEASAMEVDPAAGGSSCRPSGLAEIEVEVEVEVEVASLDAAQQPRTPPQVTPGSANNISPAAASSSAGSAVSGIRSSVPGQHFSSSALHKATGSTGEFPLVNGFAVQGTAAGAGKGQASVPAANMNGQQQQLVAKPEQLPPLKASSITLAQLSSRSSKAAVAAAERGQKQGSAAAVATAGVLATAGIKSQDLQQLLTPLSWKLYQQQHQQENNPSQQEQQQQQQQQRSRYSFSHSTPGSTVASAGSASSVESSRAAAAGPPAALAAAASGTAGSTAGSSRRALLEHIASGSSSSRTHRRSFELPGASGVSAVFGASRQHVARMLQEAGTVDPRMLYKTLTKAGGTLAVATSLAGALPGCVSDKLVQCVEVSSSMNAAGGSAACCAAAAAAAAGGAGGAAAGGSGAVNSSRVSFDRRSSSSAQSEVCAVCMDKPPAVALAGCGHVLCFDCTRCIVQEGVGSRAPLCPFCRLNMTGFGLVPLA